MSSPDALAWSESCRNLYADFGIDYDGREIGRWRWRQNYLYENPGTTELDAENALADARALAEEGNGRNGSGGL